MTEEIEYSPEVMELVTSFGKSVGLLVAGTKLMMLKEGLKAKQADLLIAAIFREFTNLNIELLIQNTDYGDESDRRQNEGDVADPVPE